MRSFARGPVSRCGGALCGLRAIGFESFSHYITYHISEAAKAIQSAYSVALFGLLVKENP